MNLKNDYNIQSTNVHQRTRYIYSKRATKRNLNPPCSMHDMLLHSQGTRRAPANSTPPPASRRPRRRPCLCLYRLTHPHPHPLTHNRHRYERPSKLVRRSVAGFQKETTRRTRMRRWPGPAHLPTRRSHGRSPDSSYQRPFGTTAAAPLF